MPASATAKARGAAVRAGGSPALFARVGLRIPVVSLPNHSPTSRTVAGGGIGGMAVALTLHQIGVPCQVLETVPELPLGVGGINVQPNAVRELYGHGLGASN